VRDQLNDANSIYYGYDANDRLTFASIYDAAGRLLGEYDGASGNPVAETIWLSPSVANDNQPIGGDDGIGGYAPLAVVTGLSLWGTSGWRLTTVERRLPFPRRRSRRLGRRR
jgi:hypothetical protein